MAEFLLAVGTVFVFSSAVVVSVMAHGRKGNVKTVPPSRRWQIDLRPASSSHENSLDMVRGTCIIRHMDTLQRTVTILTDSVAALAALAGDAAKEGSYDSAAFLIDLAKDVANLASKARTQLDPGAKASSEQAMGLQISTPTITPVVKSPIRGRPKREQYPKFLREGNNLVKIGWSPSEKAEYEHKSPRKTIPLLILAFSKIASNGRRFSMDKVLPLVDPSDGNRVPDYQAYLCLAWLRNLGFLTQHGRQGYSLTTRAPIEPLIETHWANLPTR